MAGEATLEQLADRDSAREPSRMRVVSSQPAPALIGPGRPLSGPLVQAKSRSPSGGAQHAAGSWLGQKNSNNQGEPTWAYLEEEGLTDRRWRILSEFNEVEYSEQKAIGTQEFKYECGPFPLPPGGMHPLRNRWSRWARNPAARVPKYRTIPEVDWRFDPSDEARKHPNPKGDYGPTWHPPDTPRGGKHGRWGEPPPIPGIPLVPYYSIHDPDTPMGEALPGEAWGQICLQIRGVYHWLIWDTWRQWYRVNYVEFQLNEREFGSLSDWKDVFLYLLTIPAVGKHVAKGAASAVANLTSKQATSLERAAQAARAAKAGAVTAKGASVHGNASAVGTTSSSGGPTNNPVLNFLYNLLVPPWISREPWVRLPSPYVSIPYGAPGYVGSTWSDLTFRIWPPRKYVKCTTATKKAPCIWHPESLRFGPPVPDASSGDGSAPPL